MKIHFLPFKKVGIEMQNISQMGEVWRASRENATSTTGACEAYECLFRKSGGNLGIVPLLHCTLFPSVSIGVWSCSGILPAKKEFLQPMFLV